MRRIFGVSVLVCLVACAFWVGRSSAQDGGMPAPEWTKLTEHHKNLAKSAGEFNVDCQFWMMPGGAPMEIKATATRELILNGRFVQETFRSNFMGAPYEGRLLQGYDTIAKEWFTVWIDSGNPVMSVNRGAMKDGKLSMLGKQPDFMSGKMKEIRMAITTSEDGNSTTVESFDVLPDGKEHRTMKLHYTRK